MQIETQADYSRCIVHIRFFGFGNAKTRILPKLLVVNGGRHI
jgi:hypothetical protein